MSTDHRDQLAVALSMMDEAAEVAFENVQPQPHLEYLLEGAKARFAEAQALLQLSASRPYIFNQKLVPLIRAVDDVMDSAHKHINRIIDENLPESDLEAEILEREAATTALDQARLAGCAMLVHLSKAMGDKPALALVRTNV